MTKVYSAAEEFEGEITVLAPLFFSIAAAKAALEARVAELCADEEDEILRCIEWTWHDEKVVGVHASGAIFAIHEHELD
jgi:hypothetical protein